MTLIYNMPKERNSGFMVVDELKELSLKADYLIHENIPHNDILNAWFSEVKETVLRIKTCTSVTEIEFPPEIKSVLGVQKQTNLNTVVPESQRERVHAEKNATFMCETDKITAEKGGCKIISNDNVCSKSEVKAPTFEKIALVNGGVVAPVLSTSKKIISESLADQSSTPRMKLTISSAKDSLLCQKRTPKLKEIGSTMNISKNDTCISQQLVETTVMNRTFNKVIDEKSKAVDVENNDSIKISRSSSKQKLHKIETNNTPILTKSGSKQKLHEIETNNFRMQTRSGSKRKSSVSKNELNKKQKTDISGIPAEAPASKSSQSKQPLVNRNVMKVAINLASENKAKVSAVIVPSMKQKTSTTSVSKEKQIMEEIQKKEKKANENRKKVLAERQLKAEINKKKRDEKMEKTLQKRLEMEKEKEERLEKKVDVKNSQAKVLKESGMKTRTKELIELHAKESKSGVLTSSKQNESNEGDANKTPLRKKAQETENYEMTPVPDSSTYDYSDGEDEKPSGKPIPLWAQGVHLRSALIHQFYHPPNTDELFGYDIVTPNLAEFFCIEKKKYKQRTSSAVWNSSPDRSFQ